MRPFSNPSSKSLTLLSSRSPLVVVALALLGLGACPRSLPPESEWRKVEAATSQPEDPAAKARRERAERIALEAKIKKMRAGFATDEERACTADAQCTLTPQHCCTCAAGGQYDAVNAEKLPELIKRRGIICEDYVCPQVVSTHPSCNATRAVCREGKCAPEIPEGAKAVEGIGVEPIAPDDKAAEKAPAPAPEGGATAP